MSLFFAGIDPGFEGALAWMNAAGSSLHVRDMPITTTKKDRQREYDLYGLRDVFSHLRRLPGTYVGIENPTTRPGEGSERSERFGRGKGYLEAFAFCKGLQYVKIAPNLWKGRLGLDGKEHAGANERAAELFEQLYPQWAALIRGPRGGILDGRLDALLIAHGMRIGVFQAKYSEFVEVGKAMRNLHK